MYGLIATTITANKVKVPECINLESVSANVVIRGFVAHLSIKLCYRNHTDNKLEVSYVCPVDAKAAVYSFNASLDGRTITAHCLERKKAEDVYKKAVKQGHTAILGSEDELSGDIIHLALGNLPKGRTAEMNLKMVMELPVTGDGAITFTLPTVFNPRYSPADQIPGPSFPFAGSHHRVITNRSQYSLEVKGEVRGSFKIAKVTSESDPINVEISDEDTTASITQDGGSSLDHDWSFQVFYQTVHKPQVLQMAGDRSGAGIMKDDVIMINLFPEIPLQGFSPHNEIIFVIDRSGSMQGSNIQKAKNTLLLFLKSLPPGCRFNIISFGSSYSSLFESSSERYTEETLQKALQLQKSMEADMGGTEILEALKSVYSKEPTPGYPRQMIILTDGAVWNLKQVFDLVSRHACDTRVFAVGIGEGASTALVQGMATAGGGRYEMVVQETQLQMKVMGLVASMLQDSVRDLNVEIEVEPPQATKIIPNIPPVLFGGTHLILYARIPPKTKVNMVRIKGLIADRKLNFEIEEKYCQIVHDQNLSFHRLAAKAQLKQWEMEKEEGAREKMVELSECSSVVCSATAFVGVDQDNKTIQEEESDDSEDDMGYGLFDDDCGPVMQRNVMRSSRSRDVSDSEDDMGCSLFDSDCSPPRSPGAAACRRNVQSSLLSKKLKGRAPVYLVRAVSATTVECDSAEVETKEEKSDDGIFLSIVSSQKFDGSWDLESCRSCFTVVDSIIEKLRSELSLDDACLATALMLAFLNLKLVSKKQEWQLLETKGKMFLQSKKIPLTDTLNKATLELEKMLKEEIA